MDDLVLLCHEYFILKIPAFLPVNYTSYIPHLITPNNAKAVGKWQFPPPGSHPTVRFRFYGNQNQ